MPESGSRAVDVALFEIDGRLLAADALDVAQIARRAPRLRTVSRLGAREAARVLLVRGRDGLAQVPIARFVGIEQASTASLRRLPSFLGGLVEPALLGFLLRAEEIVLLIDLQALVDEGEAAENAEGTGAAAS